jgi:uncharacterized protein YkwD
MLKKLKNIIKIIIIATAIIAAALNWDQITDLYTGIFSSLPKIKDVVNLTEKKINQTLTKEINAPPPLKSEKDYEQSFLTQEGVIKYTNLQREKNNLPPLIVNSFLNSSAQLKVQDMFDQQYFEHVSPDGQNIEDLANQAGYEFIIIGENLALGNFLNDEDLVEGWMNSPGHRANILNPRYTQIGIAVLKASYQGKTTWMAVQHFGLPLSACPQPDQTLLNQIQANKEILDKMEADLKGLKDELNILRPKRGDQYNQLAEQYNGLVEVYNSLIAETETLIDQYNQQVVYFNQCANQQ